MKLTVTDQSQRKTNFTIDEKTNPFDVIRISSDRKRNMYNSSHEFDHQKSQNNNFLFPNQNNGLNAITHSLAANFLPPSSPRSESFWQPMIPPPPPNPHQNIGFSSHGLGLEVASELRYLRE